MNIPEQAIKAATERVQAETLGAEWSRRIATLAVEAAAPIIAAEAWDAGFMAGLHAAEYYNVPTNPYRSADA